jgi:hypothetical protein
LEPQKTTALSIRASLDVPGETRRQAVVFAIWLLCSIAAVVAGSAVGTHLPMDSGDAELEKKELARSRVARMQVAFVVGFATPLLLTWWVTRRRRRGGPHARGIVLEITEGGELRLWGRGYGTRLPLNEARIDERLVDIYAGRLGAWRERRLTVATGARTIAFGTPAHDADSDLPAQGGEGDCVEFDRDDFLRMRDAIMTARG